MVQSTVQLNNDVAVTRVCKFRGHDTEINVSIPFLKNLGLNTQVQMLYNPHPPPTPPQKKIEKKIEQNQNYSFIHLDCMLMKER